jgi:predicted nucleic acid-binding protein
LAGLIVDASAVAGFLFKDETSAAAIALLDRAIRETVRVPAIWPLECANMIRQAERRRRIGSAEVADAVDLLTKLVGELDNADLPRALGPVLALSRRHGLTAYDASYLELALRTGLPLATRDQELIAAARAEGVPLLTA